MRAQMRASDRFDRTEPWGSFAPDAGSGIRLRPDLNALPEPTPPTAKIPLETQTKHTTTARLAPIASRSAPPPSVAAPVGTQPLAVPLQRRASYPSAPPPMHPSAPPAMHSSAPPAMHPSAHPSMHPSAPPGVEPAFHAAFHAAVQASVHASVQAMLGNAMAWRAPQLAAAPTRAPARSPAPVLSPWTRTERFALFATTLVLAVIATLLAPHALGGFAPEATPVVATRTTHAATTFAATSMNAAGPASRKDPAVAAVSLASTRRAPAITAPAVVVAVAPAEAAAPAASAPSAPSDGASPDAKSASAKLEDAARSAKMLRDQLSTAVN
jgi:hypothetical protein